MSVSHFLFPLWGRFVRLYAFSQSCKVRLDADSLLFSFAWQFLMLRFECFLPVLQSQASSLHVLPSCLYELALAIIRVCTGNWLQGRGVCRWSAQSVGGYLWASEGDPQAKHPSGSLAGFLMESVKWLVGCTFWYAFWRPWLLFSQLLPSPESLRTPQHSRWDKNEVGLLVASHTAAEAGWSHVLLSPMREIMGQEGLSWHWAVPPWGRDDSHKGVPLTLFSASSLGFFCSSGVLELLHWTPGLPQRHCYPWVII